MTTNTNPAPATLAELLLDYFAAATDDQTDDALDAIIDYLDAAPPSNTDDLALMLRACAADETLADRIRAYINN